jgi:hypothetical protein
VLAGKDIHATLLAPILSKLIKKYCLGDPAKVNPLFDDVLAVYEAEDAANDDRDVSDADKAIETIIDATPHAEIVDYDPTDDVFRLTRIDHIGDDFIPNILDQIEESVRIFEPDSATSNEYQALNPEIAKLADASVRYAQKPVMLLKRVNIVELRIDAKIASGYCPTADQDANIKELKKTLQDVQVELIAFSPEVKKYYDSKPLPVVDDVLPAIAEGVDLLASQSDAALGQILADETQVLNDPESGETEKRSAYSHLIGLIARGAKAMQASLDASAKTVKNIGILGAGAGTFYAWYTSPTFVEAIKKVIQSMVGGA